MQTRWGLKNVIVESTKSCIVINGPCIEAVYTQPKNLEENITWKDYNGAQAFPAMVSMHEHDRWGEPEKEDPGHLEAACLEGGMATIAVMPNTKPSHIWCEQTEARMAGFKNSRLTVKAFGGITRNNFQERQQMLEYYPEVIAGFKLYMASSTNPETLIEDRPSQRRILEENATLGALTVVHAEAEDLINFSRQELKRRAAQLLVKDHCKVRASFVEEIGIRRILEDHWEIKSPAPIHIAHLSTPGGLAWVKKAQDRGQKVTSETCPHYFVLNDTWVDRPEGGFYKMNPALRTPEEQRQLRYALCQSEINVVTTDHAPHKATDKMSEDLDKCPSGVPGVQTAMLLTYQLYASGLITQQQFVNMASRNAAVILGLNKGVLAPGFDADIVLIEKSGETKFTNAAMKYKCGYTPFDGMVVHGQITKTIFGGQVVYP